MSTLFPHPSSSAPGVSIFTPPKISKMDTSSVASPSARVLGAAAAPQYPLSLASYDIAPSLSHWLAPPSNPNDHAAAPTRDEQKVPNDLLYFFYFGVALDQGCRAVNVLVYMSCVDHHSLLCCTFVFLSQRRSMLLTLSHHVTLVLRTVRTCSPLKVTTHVLFLFKFRPYCHYS